MTCGYGIDAIDAAHENQSASNAAVNRSEYPRGHDFEALRTQERTGARDRLKNERSGNGWGETDS